MWEAEKIPKLSFVIQSYDTAFLKKETADYSAITTWGIFYPDEDSPANLILLDAVKGRYEFPELRRVAKEQYDYWKTLGDEELESFAWDSEEYVEENRIPEDMDFLPSGWYECDNVEHIWGCDLDSTYIEIDLPNGETIQYNGIYELKQKYEDSDEGEFDDIGKGYWLDDEMIREQGEVYTHEGHNFCYEPGYYFTAYSSEKGGFIDCKFELPEGHDFDERRLVFFTYDLDGNDFLDGIGYIFPDDSTEEPTMLDNEGGDTTGKGFECNIFQITRAE